MKKQKRWKIKKEYLSGKKVTEICRENGISSKTLYYLLQEEGIQMRTRSIHDGCFCPFFIQNILTTIKCEAVFSTVKDITICFGDKKQLLQHKVKYCKRDFANCAFYKMAMREHGEEERN